MSPHLLAVLQALFVTLLWSSSWVIVKMGLADIPALTFAGLRYTLAAICLMPFAIRRERIRALGNVNRRTWMYLVALGILFYAVTQGGQFLGLALLPAITTSLIFSFSTILIALLSIVFLKERPTLLQWGGVGLYLLGLGFYFHQAVGSQAQWAGFLAAGIAVLANGFSAVLGRGLNRSKRLEPVVVTFVSMSIGGPLLLAAGLMVEGIPHIGVSGWLMVAWLAVVNSALAFSLWNHVLRTLKAFESSIINNTMLVQIAILAWLFLGERPDGWQLAGMGLAVLATFIIQLRPQKREVPDATAN
jgi:drug/metabolite transporter (DMT)-like permease